MRVREDEQRGRGPQEAAAVTRPSQAARPHDRRASRSSESIASLQRAAGNHAVVQLLEEESQLHVPVSGGRPLDSGLRTFMEARLGADFSSVRVHTDPSAAASAAALQAKAYTAGEHVVFGSGSFRPDTDAGRHTLAHELAHVVQQRSGPVDGTPIGGGLQLSHPDDRFERAAEATAHAVLQRDELDDTP